MVKMRTNKKRDKKIIDYKKIYKSSVKKVAKMASESDEASSVGSDGDLEFTNDSDDSLPTDDFDNSGLDILKNSNIDNSDEESTEGDDENSDDSDVENSGEDDEDSESNAISKHVGSSEANDNSESDENQESDADSEIEPEDHKKSLQKLKETDPDFYQFLEENDKNLLNFDLNTSDEEDTRDDDADEEATHTPGELHGDSDESDYEPEDGSGKVSSKKITFKMVTEWQNALRTEGKMKLAPIATVIKAFHAAMLRVAPDADTEHTKDDAAYKIEGSSIFNAVVQMCVLYLQPALKKYLNLEQSGKDPQKCKHFVKVKTLVIDYLTDMMKLLGGVTSPNIMSVLLKHLHQMSTFVACFSRISKQLLKKLISLWSSSEETVRVLAFLCILRITRNLQTSLLDGVLKSMYMTYIKNCKFVSPTTWPGINFMRRSLVEMFSLDLNVSYHHVFLYIRQLAIHLRNAIVVKKIESRQAVYNWQFINSMSLWAELLGATCNKPQLQPLVYPLVMIITNTIKLVPTPQYYPLRFHCVDILIQLSKDSGTFMPVLPFILEVLTQYDFGKKSKKISMKPLDFSCILRLSKSQLSENSFKDTVIEKVYGGLLQYAAHESSSIAFPDLVIPTIIQLKQFTKNSSVANYTRKLRQLLEKIEENSKFIEKERSKVTFALTDSKLISAWETTLRNKGTPLTLFYDNWYKLNRIQKRKRVTKNDELAERLPVLKKRPLTEKKVQNAGPVELFPSDSEDEAHIRLGPVEPEEEVEPQKKKHKKVKKSKVKTVEAPLEDMDMTVADDGDDVQDFNVRDW